MLVNDAIKLFYEGQGHMYEYTKQMLTVRYVPIFKIESVVYIHVETILLFAHKFNPDKFKALRRDDFNSTFKYKRCLRNARINRSFRTINETDFNKIIS